MHHAILLIASLVVIGGKQEQTKGQDPAHAYRCNDIVVVGRLKNGAWEHVEIIDDLLGHGWASATLKIRKRVRGVPPAAVIPVRYFDHTYLRDDRDFMFVLRKADDGGYVIATAQLMSAHPRLAEPCT